MKYPDSLDECRGPDGTPDLEKVTAWERRINEERVAYAGELVFVREKLLGVQVCASKGITIERVVELVNRLNPAGTRNGWVIDESLAPVVCADDSGRLHYILVC
jgi:hypothetical protein